MKQRASHDAATRHTRTSVSIDDDNLNGVSVHSRLICIPKREESEHLTKRETLCSYLIRARVRTGSICHQELIFTIDARNPRAESYASKSGLVYQERRSVNAGRTQSEQNRAPGALHSPSTSPSIATVADVSAFVLHMATAI